MYDKTAIEYLARWWETVLVIILDAPFSRLYGPPFFLVFEHFFQLFGLSVCIRKCARNLIFGNVFLGD